MGGRMSRRESLLIGFVFVGFGSSLGVGLAFLQGGTRLSRVCYHTLLLIVTPTQLSNSLNKEIHFSKTF